MLYATGVVPQQGSTTQHGSGAYLPTLLTSRQAAPEWLTSAEIATMINLAVV